MTIQVPNQGVYRIDTVDSTISFRAKHQFGTGTVRGSFELTGGAIVVAVPHEGSSAHASANALSFVSGNKARDRKVKSKTFLNAEAYPEISFASTSFQQVDDVWHLRGILTARGGRQDENRQQKREQENGQEGSREGGVQRFVHSVNRSL